MRNLYLIGLLALGLTGCAAGVQPSATTIPAQSAYIAINTFNTLKGGATAYDSLPRCGAPGAPVTCNTLATVKLIDADVRTATVPARKLQALLDAACGLPTGATPSSTVNCAPVSITAYDALESAIQTLQTAYQTYGITAPAS